MFRRARKKRRGPGIGLRAQMLTGLLLIFLASSGLLYWIADGQIAQNRETQIVRELQTVRESVQVYVRQLLLVNGENNDEGSFRKLAGNIAQELPLSGLEALVVCSVDGEPLAKRGGTQAEQLPDEGADLLEAIDGNAAFTLSWPTEERLTVVFSMPVEIAGNNVGIIRGRMDYSQLWQQGRQMEDTILRIAAGVFAAAFVLIALFLNQVLKAVRRLSRVSRQMTLDLEREEVNTELLSELADSGRRDEIGELSRNYSLMLNRTGRYIGKMQEDRDRIQELLESRQEFYNNVTHELKTPLTTIQGYAQLLEADEGQDRELLQKGVSHILHESERLHRMVLQLLEMADKKGEDERKSVDVSALIRSVAEAMEIRANRYGNHICLELQENLAVTGSPERLRQVFINLIDNAVKYGEAGTQIRVGGQDHGKGILIFVENRTGRAFEEGELARIFEPFYRADKEYSREQGSAGLGLSICRKIMREHGGRIWAESGAPGRIRFFLLFPKGGRI